MCDYSLHHVGSRPAKVSDKLVTTELAKASTRGFAAVGELGAKLVIDDAPPKVAVCLMPGTELAFDDDVQYDRGFLLGKARIPHKLARFREIDTNDPHVHHDALEFPDGQILKVTRLVPGQTARVLQLPANGSHHDHDDEAAAEAARAARQAESRLAVNRIAPKPGMATFLMPSQNSVMLWRTCRSTAVSLSNVLEHSFRRLKPHHKQDAAASITVPSAADAVRVEGPVAARPPRTPAVPKPESKAAA